MDAGRLGFSTACFAGHSIVEAAELGWRLGFRSIELLAFDGYRHSQGDLAGFYFERMDGAEQLVLKNLVEPFEHVSTHAPFIDIPLFAPNPGIKEAAARQIEIAIEATAYLGGETTTCHAAWKQGYALEEYWGEMLQTFRELGDKASQAGITLTIETGHPTGVETFARLLHEIDHPSVGANVDVGHLVGYLPPEVKGTEEGAELYRKTLLDQLKALGEKVYHFHLHDLRLEDFRDHRAAGRGFLDYREIMGWCEQAGYQGLWAFELEEPDLVEALRESRETVLAAV